MPDLGAFDPAHCDLCGSLNARPVVDLRTGRALRSDRVILPRNLRKVECLDCGLVRSDGDGGLAGLGELYRDEYTMSTDWEEHVFYTLHGPLPRSVAFADWLTSAAGAFRWEGAARVLEIGSGAGALLAELTRRFPDSVFEGIELNQEAAEMARRQGLAVVDRLDAVNGPYDIVVAVAVIEHVPSPARFLAAVHRLLRPGGLLYLCQPTQDVPSYDLFFIDHLHHFASEHLRAYAGQAGFREVALVVGHQLMPNFSLHTWRAVQSGTSNRWIGPPVETTCVHSGRQIQADMARLDTRLADLQAQGRHVAAFGVNEAFWLVSAYSSMGAFPITCGLDDRPVQPHHARLDFPVVRPEECAHYGVQDVLLTMNAVHYPLAIRRLEALGLQPLPVFSYHQP